MGGRSKGLGGGWREERGEGIKVRGVDREGGGGKRDMEGGGV